MYTNGFIIQEDANLKYRGIDGSGFSYLTFHNWYLNWNDEYQSMFEPYYDEYIGKTHYILEPHTWVAACTDLDYICRYIEVSKKLNISYRILLVKTEIPNPIMENLPDLKMKFLGYDYAYENGDNYSAVYNDIPTVFPNFTLNENELFETREEIEKYILQREEYKKVHPPYTLEEGDFTIFELYEVEI